MNKLTMTIEELRIALGVSYCTAHKLTKQKGFPSFRIGKRVLINREGFEKWLKEQEERKGLCE